MRISGLASGMDIDQLVKDLMTAERIPLDRLTQQKIWTEWQQEATRDFNLKLTELRSSAEKLRFQSAFNAYSASSSNPSSVTATTSANAQPGTYSVEVISLASSAKMNSTNAIVNADGTSAKSTDKIGTTGTISIKDQSGAVIVDIEVTAEMTYKDLASKIQNSTTGKSIELRANFDDTTSRFFIGSKGMGQNQNFNLDFSSDTLAKQVINDGVLTSFSTTNATDGNIKFDGIDITGLTTNKTTVNGITLDLLHASTGTSTITVKTDTSKPIEAIKEFVEKYNETIEEIENKLIEKRYRDFQPLTEEQREAMDEKEIELWEEKAKSGLLRNDPLLQSAVNNLRRAFMDPVEGIAVGGINLLSQIGISTGHYSEGAKLTINEDKLAEALTTNPDGVMQLFTKKDGGLGISERVYKELNTTIKSLSDRAGNPNYSVDTNSTLAKKISQMNDQIQGWQDRLYQIEDRYYRQFTAMEKALNQMNQQSLWMQQNMFGGF